MSKVKPTEYDPKRHTDVETIKVNSNYLRGTLEESLQREVTGAVADDDQMLIKFHGSYQQDDRDLRNERRKQKLEPLYSFMIRARLPGGVATSEQYKVLADIAQKYGGSSLRLTTRQTYQWHGVFKRDLKKTIAGINTALVDSIAACGDVNRNVMANPLYETSKLHQEVYEWSKKISEHLLPNTNAYHEIWLDGEKVETTEEPIYGKTYLPRKFKIAIAVPPYNDVDVYANDIGLVAIAEGDKLIGFNILAGGGMGSSHGDPETYPRVASVLGFCRPQDTLATVEAILKVQRDYGNREVRKLARLKYTVDRLTVDGFKDILADYLGWQLDEAKPFEFEHNGDRYGWIQTDDGNWHLTLYIHSGRIKDSEQSKVFSGLLAIADIHDGEFRCSPNQNLIISNVTEENKAAIEGILSEHNISIGEAETPTRLNSLACVAFPTCALAMAEAERYLPTLIDKIEDQLEQHGISEVPINIRMTGCPNGCARPYLGEIGFVGKAPGKYNLYLGASHQGDRVNKLYRENINEAQILEELSPIFESFAANRKDGEFFGDYVVRQGYVNAVHNGSDFHS
ncbi:assimilatory sulfite reductase (NADPH) hemoprotein subunit [Kangiella shandongensis]|uniref:assimilatory sulfite reductase (NADPH) hemoprotein subunit n=1 Tax=Kangiella shandongensis TaxID=2763258 RepID=UPI001CBF49A0|nr:assimilatory sulfite reductase (NADPH) hemoprotein subunit [Kangiella shandongensis]